MKQRIKLGLKGIHRITVASVSEPEAKKMHDRIAMLDRMLQAATPSERKSQVVQNIQREFVDLLRSFNGLYGYKTLVIENVTCDDGRTRIAKALSGNISTTDEIEVNYVAVGTSSTAPATSDTQLGTETFRKQISSVTYSGDNFYGTAFYAAGEATATLQEHGLFIEGGAGANSGELLSHLLLGGIVKGAGDTLTVETEIQINDA